jgi:hypothetical protein
MEDVEGIVDTLEEWDVAFSEIERYLGHMSKR